MRYFHKQQAHFWKPIINLDKVHTNPFPLRIFFWSLGTAKMETKKKKETPKTILRQLVQSTVNWLTGEFFFLAVVTRPHRDPRCLRLRREEGHRPRPRPSPSRLLQAARQGPHPRNPPGCPRKMGQQAG